MNSPFRSGAQCQPIAVEDTFRFRGEMLTVVRHGWQCEATGREFSTPSQEDELHEALQNAWRQRHHVPTPQALKSLRKEYGLSAKAFSKMLGLGPNQYTRYENGELPTRSKAVLLAVVADPEGLQVLLRQQADALAPKVAERLRTRVAEPTLANLCVNSEGVIQSEPTRFIRANPKAEVVAAVVTELALTSADYGLTLATNDAY